MKKKIVREERNGIIWEYEEIDGILYPIMDISNDPEMDKPLGKYGRMAMKYLKENYPMRYKILMIDGELMPLMHKVDKEAKERLEILEKQLLKKNPIKDPEDFYQTYRHRQMIRDMAEEVVLKEIVYKER
ncbi:MAG: TnpV protein [Tissierellia bacterium]|nr:TnpV protein [Tissierellia bacterium]